MAVVKDEQMRTVSIVGPQERLDERDIGIFRMKRGELGERLRRLRSTPSIDPFRRIFAEGNTADEKNCLMLVVARAADGAVNPNRIQVTDPAAMSKKIKEVARFFGADVVGITYLDQAYVFTHRARACEARGEKAGEEINLPHRFAIMMGIAGRYDMYRADRSRISEAEYGRGQFRQASLAFLLAAYIRELGYPARAHHVIRSELKGEIPLAMMAGLGELGRNGLLINDKYGPALTIFAVTTDLPLVVDHPVDIGVEDFCKLCMKCARNCPSRSIPFGGKEVHNGVEKWRVNGDSCHKLRAFHTDQWEICLTCVVSCPYYKRDTWWHTLALWLIKGMPIPLRPLIVKPLLWIDDLIWGKEPHRKVKWLDYDSAYTPEEKPCKVPGCAIHGPEAKAKKLRVRKRQVAIQPRG